CISSGEKLLRLGLRMGQFLFDLFGIRQTLGNFLPPFREHFQNGLVGEAMQKKGNNAEADHLRDEKLLVETKLLARGLGEIHQIAGGEKKMSVHKISNAFQARGTWPRAREPLLHEEDREEYDTFGEGSAQDRKSTRLNSSHG